MYIYRYMHCIICDCKLFITFVLKFNFQAPKTVKKGAEFSVKIQFKNSMPAPLIDCEWQLEGPGLVKPIRQKEK